MPAPLILPRWAKETWEPLPMGAYPLIVRREWGCLRLLKDIVNAYYSHDSDLALDDWVGLRKLLDLRNGEPISRRDSRRLRLLIERGLIERGKKVPLGRDRPEDSVRLCPHDGLRRFVKPFVGRTPDTTQWDNPTAHLVRTNLDALSFPTGWHPDAVTGFSTYQVCGHQQAATRLARGRYNVTVGKRSHRCYHALVNPGSRELRLEMRHPHGELALLDLKSCHPMILAARVQGSCPAESRELLRLLRGGGLDIYEEIGAGLDRDLAKAQMMSLMAGYYWPERRAFHRRFKARFPQITERIVSARQAGRNLNLELQRLEAKLVIGYVMEECRAARRWAVPIHDGLLVLRQDVDDIAKCLQEALDGSGILR